jgi:putative transposase
MCRCLKVSRAGYYAWLRRPVSPRRQANQALTTRIKVAHAESGGIYGSPRIHKELAAAGVKAGRHRVARLMSSAGIRGRKRKHFVVTTNSSHSFQTAPNLLKRQFTRKKPNQAWAGDITYLPTAEGWLFLAVILDLFSRRVIGWALGPRNDRALALSALEMARANRETTGVLHHSDRGVQYASDDYRAALKAAGMTASMSRVGNCWDNAVVESFFATLKTELPIDRAFKSRADARAAVFRYIECFYNRRRRHSSLGYISPEEYELQAAA